MASGFLVARFGGEHGHATTDDPTASFYNPAGLALASGTHFYVEGDLFYHNVIYDRPATAIDTIIPSGQTGVAGTPNDAVGANSGEGRLSNWAPSPFIGVSSDLGVKNLGVALSFYTPFGGTAIWDKNKAYAGNTQYPGAVDGVGRWNVIEGTIRSSYVTAAGAWRFPSARLSLGVGLNLVLSTVDTVRARNIDGTDDLVGPNGQIKEGRSLLDVSNTTVSASAGVVWQPTDDMWLGLSYQSQPGFGLMKYSGTLENKFGTSAATSAPSELQQELPDIVRIGWRWRASRQIEARVNGEYDRWSVFNRQCILDATDPNRNCDLLANGGPGPNAVGIAGNIPRNWQDAFALRASGSYFTGKTEIAASAGFDTNAVPDSTMESSLPDAFKLDLSLGAWIQLTDHIKLSATYIAIVFLNRDVPTRQRDVSGNPITMPPPSRAPDGGGSYKQYAGILNIGLGYSF